MKLVNFLQAPINCSLLVNTISKYYAKQGTKITLKFTDSGAGNYIYYYGIKIHFEEDPEASDKLEKPYSILDTTNVIVGKASPKATVYAKYNGKTFKATANSKGIYAILTDKLKADEKVVVYQKVNGVTSPKLTVKVTK